MFKRMLRLILIILCITILFSNLVFADGEYIIKVRGVYTIKNNSGKSISAIVTPIIANQEDTKYNDFLEERFTPNATKTQISDEKGNRTGEIRIESILNENSKDAVYEFLLKISKPNYNLSPEKVEIDYKLDTSFDLYLKPSNRIESNDPFIINIATKIKNSLTEEEKKNPYYVVRNAYEYVQMNMHYTNEREYSNKGAVYAARYKIGNCEDYASLMTALLRANGIPARTVTGYMIYERDLSAEEISIISSETYRRHMWVEAYINNYGWVLFDPTIASFRTEEYSVKDENGNPYIVNGQEAVIKVNSTLNQPTMETFGSLKNYYIKERYDFPEGKAYASVTAMPSSFSQDWLVQVVNYNTFMNYNSIKINGEFKYLDKPINLTVFGISSDNITTPIQNNFVTWKSSNNQVATIDNGIVKFTGLDGYVEISAEYKGKIDILKTTVTNIVSTTNNKNIFNKSIINDLALQKHIINKVQTKEKKIEFLDIDNHWAKNDINTAKELDIVGQEVQFFYPESYITREEFAMFISRAFNIQPSNNLTKFKDMIGRPNEKYITTLNEYGIIAGYTDNTFKPNNLITRAEIATIISRLIEVQNLQQGIPIEFTDTSNNWAKKDIDTISRIGIVKGTSSTTFAPNDKTTRSQAVAIIMRVLRLDPIIKNNI